MKLHDICFDITFSRSNCKVIYRFVYFDISGLLTFGFDRNIMEIKRDIKRINNVIIVSTKAVLAIK